PWLWLRKIPILVTTLPGYWRQLLMRQSATVPERSDLPRKQCSFQVVENHGFSERSQLLVRRAASSLKRSPWPDKLQRKLPCKERPTWPIVSRKILCSIADACRFGKTLSAINSSPVMRISGIHEATESSAE